MLPSATSDQFKLFGTVQNATGSSTGVAVANPSATSNSVLTVRRFDSAGTLQDTRTVTLQPQQQLSRLLNEDPYFVGLNNFDGIVEVSATQPVTAVTLRLDGSQIAAVGVITPQNLPIDTGFPFNTAVGFQSLQANTTGGGNTASGYASLGSNTTGSNNTASGFRSLASNRTGDGNTASGHGSLVSNTTGGLNTAIGAAADVSAGNLNNATAIGASAIVDASNKIRLGNTAVTVLESQVGLTVVSDRNAKEGFQSIHAEDILKKLAAIPVTSWNYIGHDPHQFRHYGPMAQDFFAAFGQDGVGRIGSETTINSSDLSGVLMVAVDALEKRTTDLQTENVELKARLEASERSRTEEAHLRERIEKLEQLFNRTSASALVPAP